MNTIVSTDIEEVLRRENAQLRAYIEKLESQIAKQGATNSTNTSLTAAATITTTTTNDQQEYENGNKNEMKQRYNNRLLTNEQIGRFSRHLLLPDIGVKRQAKLCASSALIIGAGGLGSPCAMYLVSAGIGRIGLVDFDVVDKSNLHRQVIHNELREGMSKVQSAAITCRNLNSNCVVETYDEPFNPKNGLGIVRRYDLVIDASDNVSTRYLVNDACVLAGKPLVSGSAVRLEGQLTVYNYKQKETNCPCYRCLFPIPPPPETVTNCSEGGVMGVVPGVIGVLQALEAQKILMEMDDPADGILYRRMLLFQAKTCTFKNVKIRGRKVDCAVCGDNPTIKELVSYDDILACATKKPVALNDLPAQHRITCQEYNNIRNSINHLLLDVRDPIQFEIASVEGAVNIPLKQLISEFESIRTMVSNRKDVSDIDEYPIYVMCRRGIASVTATKLLLNEAGFKNVRNIDGGITEWRKSVDTNFPTY
jgi:adenylyltransferase/sulfurtransferase